MYGIVNAPGASAADLETKADLVAIATCSTSAGTQAKTVSVTNFRLVTGALCYVKFSNTNTASSPTLNVSSTGAKTIRYKNASVAANMIKANVVYEFSYDGTYWNIVGEQPWEAEEKAQEALDTLAKLLGGKLPDPVLANNSPAVIQSVAKLGLGANFWNVGDKIGIQVNGKVSQLTLNATYYAFIIGFNHNPALEGGNGIHFQFGKTSSGTDIAFVSGCSDDSDFYMYSNGYNKGGWKNSFMRGTVCSAFFNALPTEWKNVISPCTKYSDNTGGGSDTESYVTPTQDNIWLLAEYEVFGVRSYANSAEQNYQQQYAYYKNGNSKVKYKHDSTGSTCTWWLRSVGASYGGTFCDVTNSGGASSGNAACSCGFAPGFKVA